MLPFVNNGERQCCVERSCVKNFQGIPMRVFDRNALPYHQFLVDKEKFCDNCGFPQRNPEIIDQLKDMQEDSANEVSDLGFQAVYPCNNGNDKMIQTFWQRRHRLQTRFGRGRSCRKNILNIIFYMPTKKLLLDTHQTYRYLPFHMDPSLLIERILRETMDLMQKDFQDIADFLFL